ncbi:MAG: DUF309 domain-containing protein [Bacteroidales bacterium]|nr:DUF309 domain-containing protein [Bacteroidales bacterium]
MQTPEPSKIHRYTKYDFPWFRYIPGRGIHPSKMIGKEHIPEIQETGNEFSDKTWQRSIHFLYAIDLFNAGYYWEVHEVLEKLWIKQGKDSTEGQFLQGLIQLSVALLKKEQGNLTGVRRLSEKFLPKLENQHETYLGINVTKLFAEFKKHIENNTLAPVIVLEFN